MYREKHKIKYLSRQVVLAWKKATESSNISWNEIFPIIVALYELDDNLQKDEYFNNLNIDSSTFYKEFQETLDELNLTQHNIHYFRKLTKHLLKTFLESNKELSLLQNKDLTGQESKINIKSSKKHEVSADEIIIPNVIVDELIKFYTELKKADASISGKENKNSSKVHRRSHSAPRSISTVKVPINKLENITEETSKPKKSPIRPLPPIPKAPTVSSKYTKGLPKYSPLTRSPSLSPIITPLSPKNDSVTINSTKKFVPSSNASVITVKHPKKSNLRKIKKKPLRISTAATTTSSLSQYSEASDMYYGSVSPNERSKMEDSFNISPLSHYNSLVFEEVPTPQSMTTPMFTSYPARSASLTPSSQRRMSLPKRALTNANRYDDFVYPSPSSSQQTIMVNSPLNYTNSFSLSQKTLNNNTSPLLQSPLISEASNSDIYDGEVPSRVRANSFNSYMVKGNIMNIMDHQPKNNIFKSTPTSTFRKMSGDIGYGDDLPAIPPITFNYTEEIAPTKPKFNYYEEEDSSSYPHPPYPFMSEPLSEPLKSMEYLESTDPYYDLVGSSYSLSSSQFQSQSQSQKNLSSPSSFLIQPIDHTQPHQRSPLVSEEEDDSYINDILDQYSEESIPKVTVDTRLPEHSPIFQNNVLTQEGARYAIETTLRPVGSLTFKEKNGELNVEVVDETEEKEEVEKIKTQEIDKEVLHQISKVINPPKIEEDEDEDEEEAGQVSTIITDCSVIDGLESDLLNHKINGVKTFNNHKSFNPTLSNEFILTRIEEADEPELSEKEDEKKEDTEKSAPKTTTTPENQDSLREKSVNEDEPVVSKESKEAMEKKDKRESLEEPKAKKQQFRLSFLTSKSSCSTLKRQLKRDSTLETPMENSIEDTISEEEKAEPSEKMESITTTTSTLGRKIIQTSNPSSLPSMDDKEEESLPKIKSDIVDRERSPKMIDKIKIKASTNESKEETSLKPKKAQIVFVHPVQLYNMVKMISVYTIPKLPRCSHPVTTHWMNTSNTIALGLWDILKAKEDVISQMIVYATFYDQIEKVKTLPFYDPDHVFLKELVSTPLASLQGQSPTLSHPLENYQTNQKLIVEIRKELSI